MSDDFTPDPAEMERALREIVDLEKVAGTRGDGWLWRRMWELAATALNVDDDQITAGGRFVLPGLGADGGDATATVLSVADGYATMQWTNPDRTGATDLIEIRRSLRLGYWRRAQPVASPTRSAIVLALYNHASPLTLTELADLTGLNHEQVRLEVNLPAIGGSSEIAWTDGVGSPVVLTATGVELAVALGQPPRPLSDAELNPHAPKDES